MPASACRKRRLARFLFTALPTDRVTTSPIRGPTAALGEATTVTGPCRERVPVDRTRRKSVALRSEDQSDGEALPSLTATGAHHGSAGAGLHPVPESMTSLPAAHLGLIGSLHGKSDSSRARKSVEGGEDRRRLRSAEALCQRRLAAGSNAARTLFQPPDLGSRNFVWPRENWIRARKRQFASIAPRKALGKPGLTWGSPGVQLNRLCTQGRFSRS